MNKNISIVRLSHKKDIFGCLFLLVKDGLDFMVTRLTAEGCSTGTSPTAAGGGERVGEFGKNKEQCEGRSRATIFLTVVVVGSNPNRCRITIIPVYIDTIIFKMI